MNTVGYIKSFSKGQITIPKAVRKMLGIGDDFWLKIDVENGKIVAEPVEKATDQDGYLKKILSITGKGFDPEEINKNRREVEKQLVKRRL